MSTALVPSRHQTDPSERVAHAGLALVVALLLVFLAAPLGAILKQALEDASGRFVGLTNFIAYARTPALLDSLHNSLWVSALVTAITLPLAFAFAHALQRREAAELLGNPLELQVGLLRHPLGLTS